VVLGESATPTGRKDSEHGLCFVALSCALSTAAF
jgi:hypothetical protein